MEAVRCVDCGETRWSLFRGTFASQLGEPCPACGGKTVAERRRPGRRLRKPLVRERRGTGPDVGAQP